MANSNTKGGFFLCGIVSTIIYKNMLHLPNFYVVKIKKRGNVSMVIFLRAVAQG